MNRHELNIMFQKITHIIVCGMIFLMPIFFIPTPFLYERGKAYLFFFLSVICFILYLSRIVVNEKFNIPRHRSIGALAVFLFLLILSAASSVYVYGSIWGINGLASSGLFVLVAGILFSFVIIDLSEDRSKLFLYIFIFLLTSYLVVGLSVLQIFGKFILPFVATHNKSFVFTGSILSTAIYIFATGVLSLSLFYYVDEVLKNVLTGLFAKIFLFIGVIFGIIAVMYVNNNILNLIAVAVLFLFLLFVIFRAREYVSKWLLFPAVIFAVLIIFNFINVPWSKFVFADSYGAGFLNSVHVAKKALSVNPFLGFGEGSYKTVYMRYLPQDVLATPEWAVTHNSAVSYFVTMLTDTGILGVAGFLILVFSLIYTSLKQAFFERDRNQMFFIGIFFCWFSVLLSIIFTPASISLFFIFWLMLGFIVSWVVTEENRGEIGIGTKNHILMPSVYVCTVFFILSILIGARTFVGEVLYARALEVLNNTKDINKSFGLITTAISWNTSDDRIARLYSNIALENFKSKVGSLEEKTDFGAFIKKTIDGAKTAVDLNPDDPQNIEQLASVYLFLSQYVDGAINLSVDNFNKLVALSPNNPNYYVELATAYTSKYEILSQNSKDPNSRELSDALDSANRAVEKALLLKPNLSSGLAQRAAALVLSGKNKEAVIYFEKALSYGLLSQTHAFQLALLYIQQKDLHKAAPMLDSILVQSPSFANAMWYRALIYEKEGALNKALELYKKIVQLNPQNKDAANKIAEIYSKQFADQ